MGSIFDTPDKNDAQQNQGSEGARKSIFDSDWATQKDEPTEIISKQISVWSILILVLGVLSLPALVFDTLIFIPWITLILAAGIALWLYLSGGETLGKGLLLLGFCLAAFVLIAVFTANTIYTKTVVSQGDAFARRLFDFIKSGDTLQFHLASMPSPSRGRVTDEKQYWKDIIDAKQGGNPLSTAHMDLHKNSISNPSVLSIYNYRDSVKLTLVRHEPIVKDENENSELLPLIYAATYTSAAGRTETFFFAVVLLHSLSSDGRAYWSWQGFSNKPLHP
ncbi:MAG: hypothetical protein J6S27_04105 [Thermoguttaceae bacterium]|nr:hypothetical protein [Thermoguttaceae bacterium]